MYNLTGYPMQQIKGKLKPLEPYLRSRWVFFQQLNN